MKVKKSLFILILSLLSLLCFFGACQKNSNVVQISVKQYSAQIPIEVSMGNFYYQNYTLIVTYENKSTKEIPLSEDMISDTDKLFFYKEGIHTINVKYQDKSVDILIDVKRNEFSEVVFEDIVTTYTGEDVVVEVGGEIPSGTTILYPNGNTFRQAGVYDISAVLIRDTYITKRIDATLTIEKATYDLSKANLYDKTVTYNGENHLLELQGIFNEEVGKYTQYELPSGVNFRYYIDGEEGNSAKDAGNYTISARFFGDSVNYNLIPDKTATLTIEKSSFDMSDIRFDNKTATYSGYEIDASITSENILPTGVIVSYEIASIESANIQEIESAEFIRGNTAIDAGLYAVRANYSVDSVYSKNYSAPQSQVAFLKIEKAQYDTTVMTFDPAIYSYIPKTSQGIAISGDLPLGIEKIDYTIQRIIDGLGEVDYGETLEGHTAIDAGVYYVVATFVLDSVYSKNYYTYPAFSESYMSIEAVELDLSDTYLGEIETEYDENGFDIGIENFPDMVDFTYLIKDKDGNIRNNPEDYINGLLPLPVGTYNLSLDVSIKPEEANNYYIYGDTALTGSFVVKPKFVDSNILVFQNTTMIYHSGNNYTLSIDNIPDYFSITYQSAEVANVGDSVSVWTDTINYSKEGIFAYKAIVDVVNDNYYTDVEELICYLTVFDLETLDFSSQSCEVVYDGQSHELQLPIEMPEGITVEYKITCSGQEVDTAVNVGEYIFSASFGGIGLGVADKTATLTIIPQPYDLVTRVAEIENKGLLQSKKFVYESGKNYEFVIPTNEYNNDIINVTYSSSTVTGAGVYNITISFSIKDTNYTATVIERVVEIYIIDLSALNYAQSSNVYTGENIIFALEQDAILPDNVSVNYFIASVINSSHTPEELEGIAWEDRNTMIDAGNVPLKAEFVDETTQEVIYTAYKYFTIEKCTIDVSKLSFTDDVIFYTGEELTVRVYGYLPSFVVATYTYTDKATNTVLSGAPIECGEYLVEVDFAFSSEEYSLNYVLVSALNPITLIVEKETINFSRFNIIKDYYIITDLGVIAEKQDSSQWYVLTLESGEEFTIEDSTYRFPVKMTDIHINYIENGTSLYMGTVYDSSTSARKFRAPSTTGEFDASITLYFSESDFYKNIPGNSITFNFKLNLI